MIINFKYHIKKEQLYHHIGFHRIKKVLQIQKIQLNDNSQLNQTRQTEGTTVVTSDDGKDVTVGDNIVDLTLGEVRQIFLQI